MTDRQGYQLGKSHGRDPYARNYGRYALVNALKPLDTLRVELALETAPF
jgi:hypothetical protein